MAKFFDATAFHEAALEVAQIKAAGYSAVAGYYFHSSAFKQLITAADARLMSAQGLYTVSVWENGYPTTPGYFTASQGAYDASGAIARATAAHQPLGTPIYAAYDCDLSDTDVVRAFGYAKAFHDAIKAAGYLASAYGCGALLEYLSHAGYICNAGWLSQSKSWNGFDRWVNSASIVQYAECHVLGLDVDIDISPHNSAGGWMPTG